MREFLQKVLSMILFVVSIVLFHIAATTTFTMSVMNVIIFVVAIFVLLQACGNVDKTHKFGKYAAEPETNNDVNPGPQQHHPGPPEHHKQHTPTDN